MTLLKSSTNLKLEENVLCLKDYKKIRTPFVFMDETGSINDRNNRYFALGMIKCMQPHFLDYQIRLLKQKRHFFDEIKWNTISRKKLSFIKELIDIADVTPGIKFSTIVLNKDLHSVMECFNNDPYIAYEKLTEVLIKRGIKKNEVLTVIADYISTPPEIHFEVEIKHNINEQFQRLAIAGVHRIDSNGTNLLQLNDLYLGAVIYDFKLKNKLVSGDKNKIEVMKYLLKKLGLSTFTGEVNVSKFKVDIYTNKKGPSSLRLTPSINTTPKDPKMSKDPLENI
jgi:hypothetical protein